MRKTRLQQRKIVMAVDRDTGTIDLSVFVIPSKGHRTQTVGTATLRMADVPEVVRLLSEQLRIEDQLVEAESAARRSKKIKDKKEGLDPLCCVSRRSVPHALSGWEWVVRPSMV
jgi:hypothetical protein